MPRKPPNPKVDPKEFLQSRLNAFRDLCFKDGIKLTHQRSEIFCEMILSNDHPSAEILHRQLKRKMPSLSLDTVYRTLALLERFGIIARVHHLDDCTRYDSNLTPHPHWVCKECKRVEDFHWPPFEATISPAESTVWGSVDSVYVELRGLCHACMKKKRAASPE